MSGKKLLGKPKQYSIVKSFDKYACKIQNWKFGSVPTTPCPADSRKAYCKVCNNGNSNGNGLLFHMTQPISRSTIKAIACSKPTISEN